MFDIIETTLSSALAASGTVALSYPTGRNAGDYAGAYLHKAVWGDNQVLTAPGDFTLTFGTSSITFTYGSGKTTIPAGTKLRVQADRLGRDKNYERGIYASEGRMAFGDLVYINLGAPDTADTDAFIKAATSTEAPNAETVTYTPDTDGTSPTDGVGTVVAKGGVNYWELDVPRNITSTVTHATSVVAMTITVTGLDEFENTVVETITVAATGTSQSDASLKAFKWIRSIALIASGNAEANTVNVGFGDVLGLPVALPQVGNVLRELEDGTAPTAGTLVAAVRTTATATTGDVRGTYDPNSAADGSKAFALIAWLPEPNDKGIAQYAG